MKSLVSFLNKDLFGNQTVMSRVPSAKMKAQFSNPIRSNTSMSLRNDAAHVGNNHENENNTASANEGEMSFKRSETMIAQANARKKLKVDTHSIHPIVYDQFVFQVEQLRGLRGIKTSFIIY